MLIVRYSNLIKKIREMTEAAAPMFPMPGAEMVQPRAVQRRV
jgi:hypothetical protein